MLQCKVTLKSLQHQTDVLLKSTGLDGKQSFDWYIRKCFNHRVESSSCLEQEKNLAQHNQHYNMEVLLSSLLGGHTLRFRPIHSYKIRLRTRVFYEQPSWLTLVRREVYVKFVLIFNLKFVSSVFLKQTLLRSVSNRRPRAISSLKVPYKDLV